MKSIKYIFLSYFQQYFFGTFGMIMAMILFIVGTAYSFSNSPSVYTCIKIFYFAIISLSLIMAVHLRRMVKSNASALLPNYRRNQLITSSFLLVIFIFWPVILVFFSNIPVYSVFALYLFTAAVISWSLFKFGDNILLFLILIWSIRFSYEILGFPAEIQLVSEAFISVELASLILIIVSFILMLLFYKEYKSLSVLDFEDVDRDETDPWIKDYDKCGNLINKIMQRRILNVTRKSLSKSKKLSVIFEMALFSPVHLTVVNSVTLIIILPYMASVLFLLNPSIYELVENMIPFLILFYFIVAAMLISDFLQHRDRLSLLWISSQTSSHNIFIKHTILAFLRVLLRSYISVSLIYVFLCLTFTSLEWHDILSLMASGLAIYIYLAGLALFSSEFIISPEAKGWVVFNILAACIVMALSFHYWSSITPVFFLVIYGFVGLLLFAGIRRWAHTEFDFASPVD